MKKTKFKITAFIGSMLFAISLLLGSAGGAHAGDLVISGVIDGPLVGGIPKAVELYVVNDIVDLSRYGIGIANNGGGSDGREFSFPAGSATAGEYLYVAGEADGFNLFFGFLPHYQSGVIQINGDDAIELFHDEAVIDVFGDIHTDGSGKVWDYMDGWAYRKNATGPDGDLFTASNWTFSGANVLDGVQENDSAAVPFPIGTFSQSPAVSECGEAATFIHEIQGDADATSFSGEIVTIEGVVVGDFQNNGEADNGDLNGFYVQEEDRDADTDPVTSEGIFIYAPEGSDVRVGDLVRLTGRAGEYVTSNGISSQTQISAPSQIEICAAAPLPTAAEVNLPLEDDNDLEAVEGMSAHFSQTLTISEYYNFARYGEIVLTLPLEGQQRLFQPTQIVAPGIEANQLQAINDRRRITLDDGRAVQNPDPAIHPNGDRFDLSNRFRGGDTISGATGVIDHTYGKYRLQPTLGAQYATGNLRPPAPEEVKGRIRVASFNVLNYFTTLGSRGAETVEEFERQRTKIITAIAQINADIVGLIEIENNTEAIADLVSGLNEKMGANTYAYIDTGKIGSDEIKVALIYQPATVAPIGPFKILDTSVDPAFIDTKNRPALIQTFEENSSGERFTIANNHFKSKGSACDDIDDPDSGDGQGNCNLTRTSAAQALADYLATDPTQSNDPDVLIIGDLNAYAMEDPVTTIERAGYINLAKAFKGEFAYSYVFDGQFGELDHALASTTLSQQISGATIWHINSDEPTMFDYTTRYKKPAQQALFEENAFRSSDHDPVIVGLVPGPLTFAPNCKEAFASRDLLWPPHRRFEPVNILGISDPDNDPVSVTINAVFQDEPVGTRRAPDAIIKKNGQVKLRAERQKKSNGRVYHLSFTAEDTSANTCSGEVTVGVPLRRNVASIDDGPLYDSTLP